MGRPFGSRTLLAAGGTTVILLASLAVVQYRWSTRVAAADEQREKEHLDSAASLFASAFNGIAAQAVMFLQNNASSAQQSGQQLTAVPKIIGELFYLDIPVHGGLQTKRLTPEGLFVPSPLPEWIMMPHCAPVAIEQPPAIVAPIYKVLTEELPGPDGLRVKKTFSGGPERCFVARIDEAYLRETLFQQLIRESFGATAVSEYDFAIVSMMHPGHALYGAPLHADLRKTFFSIDPGQLAFSKPLSLATQGPGRSALFIHRVESTVVGGPMSLADLFGPGIWELDVAHKGGPLRASFEQAGRRDFLFSLGVELLLIAAVAFLAVAARRMQTLANRKMQFVAGVSHELRTPVAAIALLSRNQADGLVSGAEKVKHYGELIHQQSRRLNEMVEQTLQYAGIHSDLGRPVKNEVDVRLLLEEVVTARREDLAGRGFEVEIALDPDLPPVVGDSKLLRTAIDNLIDNAQKYAAGVRWIRVSAGYSPAKKEVWIKVEDRGVGIDPADQAGIFEPFCRGRGAIEAQIPGSGLGLSLVRSAAEVHRGSVTLASEPGRGSTFTMHLPL